MHEIVLGLVAIVGIGCATGVTVQFLEYLKVRAHATAQFGRTSADTLLAELRALREEVSQLRQQNNDVVLSLDTTVHRLEQRVSSLDPGRRAAAGVLQPAEGDPAPIVSRPR
jgi:hypothetical protein